MTQRPPRALGRQTLAPRITTESPSNFMVDTERMIGIAAGHYPSVAKKGSDTIDYSP